MNLVVNDLDMPLMLRLQSIWERIQVYFIDNDEYFKKSNFADEDGVMYPDNERAIFFAKVVETVRN
jgi:starch synthase